MPLYSRTLNVTTGIETVDELPPAALAERDQWEAEAAEAAQQQQVAAEQLAADRATVLGSSVLQGATPEERAAFIRLLHLE